MRWKRCCGSVWMELTRSNTLCGELVSLFHFHAHVPTPVNRHVVLQDHHGIRHSTKGCLPLISKPSDCCKFRHVGSKQFSSYQDRDCSTLMTNRYVDPVERTSAPHADRFIVARERKSWHSSSNFLLAVDGLPRVTAAYIQSETTFGGVPHHFLLGGINGMLHVHSLSGRLILEYETEGASPITAIIEKRHRCALIDIE
jgi:hypothetical protein